MKIEAYRLGPAKDLSRCRGSGADGRMRTERLADGCRLVHRGDDGRATSLLFDEAAMLQLGMKLLAYCAGMED
jgi:hypothetical protein